MKSNATNLNGDMFVYDSLSQQMNSSIAQNNRRGNIVFHRFDSSNQIPLEKNPSIISRRGQRENYLASFPSIYDESCYLDEPESNEVDKSWLQELVIDDLDVTGIYRKWTALKSSYFGIKVIPKSVQLRIKYLKWQIRLIESIKIKPIVDKIDSLVESTSLIREDISSDLSYFSSQQKSLKKRNKRTLLKK